MDIITEEGCQDDGERRAERPAKQHAHRGHAIDWDFDSENPHPGFLRLPGFDAVNTNVAKPLKDFPAESQAEPKFVCGRLIIRRRAEPADRVLLVLSSGGELFLV